MENTQTSISNKPLTSEEQIRFDRDSNHGDDIPSDKLLAALYWLWDAFDRANVPMFLVHQTAKDVIANKELHGDRVDVGVRKMEWVSGGRRILDAVLGEPIEEYTPTEDGAYGIAQYIYEGVPVYIYSYPDADCIMSLDSKVYRYEGFKLPNPYSQFEQLYG